MWIDLIKMFAFSLMLTLVIEMIVAFFWRMRTKKELFLVVLVNILTNPAAVFVAWIYRCFLNQGLYFIAQSFIEIVVVMIESVVYSKFAKESNWQIRNPVKFAIIVNMISWLTGVVVQYII